MIRMFRSGISIRWINNAGFELILPGGAHLLVDPRLDSAQIYPLEVQKLERVDYVLLTHVHFDHGDSIGEIQKRFPDARILVGDLSAEPLCQLKHLNVEKLYRVRGGETYEFNDVKIEAISGRHTESRRGSYYMEGGNMIRDGVQDDAMWYGSLEMLNYRITTADGTTVLVWGGMTTDEQVYRMAHYKNNDIAIMHVSPKQNQQLFTALVKAINPKVVIPHHYDLWDVMFKENPEMLKDAPLPPEKMNESYILGLIKESLEKNCQNNSFLILEHHKWYRFGLGVSENPV
ncbi:MBL fold metallo-hydrolase [Clostridium sp. Marseille-P2415]|uniref:MBL fold metallo-hydrolase n=1 Tax=Clostridium sp. Marseille-P2415 TaxID=1805471 RepID=UPI00098877D7|nr:MBL fold metallo-hydrolase [Clostridium sp. Marseille-P2415]